MTPTLTKQLDLSPADIRLRARNIVVIGVIVGCSLIGLDHSLTAYFFPEKTITVLPVLGSLSGLLLMIAVSTALMRTLGGLTDESLLEKVKQVNSALAESEERYRGLFETSPDAMIYRRLGADGTMQLIDVNDAYLSLFGYKRSDITPDIASGQRLTPESRKRWHDEYVPALARDGFVDNMILDGLRTDGTSFPATARVFGIRDDAGKIVANWTTLRDMSAQENAEHELKESETKFRRLFETCQLGLIAWSIDADGNMQLDAVNDSVLAMYDMDMETARDTISKMEHITRESTLQWERDHRPTLKKIGYGKDQKLVGIRSNGSHFPILIDTWYVRDEQGNVTGLWGALRDVTESEKIEKDLKLKNRALEQSSVAVSILDRSDPNHLMYYINPAYEKMTGYTMQDFDSQQPVRFANETEEDRAALAKVVADMDQGRPTQARLWAFKKDGSRHLRDLENSPVRDDNGTITHWISVGRDITQEVEDETQLKLFKRAVEQASNSIAIIEQTNDGPRGSYLNPAFEQMTGYNLESLRAYPEAFLAVPSGKPDLRKQFDVGFETGVRVHEQLWATNRDGTPQLRDVVNSPVRDEHGLVTHWISISRDVTQEVEDEKQLRLFKRAIEQNPAAITIVEDKDGEIPRVTFANDSIERMHGFSKGAITGQSASRFVSEGKISPELADSMKEARIRGEAIDTDGYFKRPDGSDGWLALRYAPVRNDEGEITHWISYGNDITDQFRAERVQRRNSLILGQLSESLFLADMDGQTIDCNTASERTLGRSREDILGHRLSEFSPTPKLQNAKIHGRSQNSGTHEEFVDEIPLIRNDGQEILLETVSKRWLGDDGQPEGWITIGRDITEKRAAEKELRVLKRAIEQSPSAITIAEAQENGAPRIIFNNEAIRSMHGHEPSDTIGKESTTFVKSHMISDELGKRLTAARERGEAIDTSGAYNRADGTQGWMNARYAPVRDEKGEITHWIAFGTDITEQYQAEQQRRILERALEFSPTAVSILEAMPDKVLQTAYVNGAFEEMTGYARGDILNQPFSPLSAGPSADRKSSLTQISRESAQDIDERVRADGSTYIREFRSAAVQDEHGATTHYIVLSNDISARIKDEKRLRSLQIAFEQADSAISIMAVTETGNQIAFVNNAYEKMMGYSRDEVIGTTAGFLKNRDFNEARVMETWIQSVRQGRALSLTIETQRKNGAWFVRDVESNPVRDSEGTIISWISVSRDVTQKLKDEQRLHTLQMAFEQADSAISVMAMSETGSKMAFVNKAYEDMMGYARNEVIGTSTGFIKNKDYLEPGAMEKWRASVSEGQSASLTIRTQKKNGSWFLRDVETNPVRDSDGNIISWIGVSRDVTQKLEDEQRLQNLQMAIEQTDSAVTITEVVGSEKYFAFVNHAFEAMTGYTREELIGKPVDIIEIRDFLEPGSIEKQTNTIRRGGSANYYVETQRKDGSWFVRELRINPFSDSAGAVTSWIGISRDVTQKLKDEQRMRRDALILETLSEAVTFTDPDGVFLDCNKGAETLFGYSKEELVGKPTTYILADPQTQNLEHSKRVVRALEGKPTQGQDTIKRKDGEERLIELVAAPFTSSDGTFLGHVTVSRDITEKQALQEQLQHAQKMEAVGQLTGGIAHDFNNLMGVISGSLQLIEGENEDWEFVHQMARTADKSVLRGKDLVDRMLSFSRRQTLNPVETDIAELMDGTVDLLRRSIGDRINITLEYDDGLPRCLLDQAQFESAILNMSLNARDAMEPGGHLSISARLSDLRESSLQQDSENGAYVCVTIADDGIGMDDETLAKIYEPFFTTKDVGQGSGLGLSMVYGFVKQSGGHIEVESAPGEGTQFSLFFPAATKQGAGDVDTLGAPSRKKQTDHRRVLVVEDNAEMLDISRLSLTRMGYDVVTAASATAAMTQLTDNPDIKIAFIDIMLPDGMTGTELAKLLVSVRPELRVLFTSGYSDPSILKDAMDISQVIRKPFTLQELEDALGGLVAEPKRLH